MRAILILGLIAAFAVAGAAQAQTVIVKGQEGRMETLTAADIHAMHRATVTVPYGDKSTFEGAMIGEVLAEVGAPADVRLHGAPVNQVVIVTGKDGFSTVLSLAETEKSFRTEPVILADTQNGKPLDEKQGPYRLVIGGELKPARSVWGVIEIELRPVNTNDPSLKLAPMPAMPPDKD
jgi:hypothetical protein